jgi:hypothetical protein
MAIWTPALNVSILRGWWDFSDSSKVTTVSGGISSIADKSGLGYSLTQATSSNRPSYQTAAQNGLNVARFDGTNDRLARSAFTSGVANNQPCMSLFVVRKPLSVGFAMYSFSVTGASSSVNRMLMATGVSANKDRIAGRGLDTDTEQSVDSSANDTAATWRMQEGVWDFDNAKLTQYMDGTKDGEELSFGTGVNAANTSPNQMVIGCSNLGTGFFSGDIGEVILVAGVLSDRDRWMIEGYLAHKWGIASLLPSDHLYKTEAPQDPPRPLVDGDVSYLPEVVASVSQVVEIEGDVSYSPSVAPTPSVDTICSYTPEVVGNALAANEDGVFVTSTITEENIHIYSDKAESLNDIPIGLVAVFPKDVLLGAGYGSGVYPALNYETLEADVYEGTLDPHLIVSAPGHTYDYDVDTFLRHTLSGEIVGAASLVSFGGNHWFSGSVEYGGTAGGPSVYPLLPGPVSVKVPNVTNIWGGSDVIYGVAPKPGAFIVKFEPDASRSNYVFVDNLAFGGSLFCYMETQFDSAVGTPDAEDNNQFIGLLKRSAQHKRAGELLDSDIVLGILSTSASARIIVNGTEVAEFTHSSPTDMRELYLETFPQSDSATWTVEQWNNIPFQFSDSYGVSYDSSYVYDEYEAYNGEHTVNMAEAVFAAINDADFTGIGGSVTGSDDGYYYADVSINTWFDVESAWGSYYELESVSLPPINTAGSISYAPSVEGVLIQPDLGVLEAPVTIKVMTSIDYAQSHIFAPIEIQVTSVPATFEAPIEIEVEPNTDTLQAPIVIDVSGVGALEAPIVIGVHGDKVKWEAEVFIGGVDYSARLSGQLRVEAEEGSARIANFSIIPVNGVVNAFGFSGSSVIINYVSTDSGAPVSQRLFTGLVDSVEYDPNTRFLSFDCTDNLQNKIAGMTRAAINHLTGGRFSESISGDSLSDNWEYAQECMRAIPASLDAGRYAELRVTNWHLPTVNRTETEATIIDESLSVELARRADIINKVNVNYEFRFNRLRERIRNITWRIDPYVWLKAQIPLLAKDTVESALESTGWNVDIAQYTPFPEFLFLDEGGRPTIATDVNLAFINRVIDPQNTCMELSARLRLRFAQTVTEAYQMVVTASQSIDKNGTLATDISASSESSWESSDWENDYSAEPTLTPTSPLESVLDYHPDISESDKNRDIELLIDIAKVELLAAHRTSKVTASVVIDPSVDLTQRRKIDTDTVVAQGKVTQFVHELNFDEGTATTEVTISVSGHGSSGLTPVESPTEAPEKPEIPESDFADPEYFGAYPGGMYHIGARADSEEFNENWEGWIVNQRSSVAVQGMGSSIPLTTLTYNEDGSVNISNKQDEGFTGNFSNPGYVASKAYEQEGFKIIMPGVEEESRDATEVVSEATYDIPIPEDEFILSA